MNYPLISEYIESIRFAEENFQELKNLRPVLNDNGDPVMTSGNFAVVFKMKDEQTGKLHAVKCFLKEQEGRAEAYRMIAEELECVNSTFLTPIKYLDKELFVDTNVSDETDFPVLLMDWVEGVSLDNYTINNKFDGYKLSCLVCDFFKLSTWLLEQPFAHGDLKPDNILVREDGSLVLIDYDGMFVPKMLGQEPREKGTPNYRNPFDDNNYLGVKFNKRIDDFAIIHILLSLKIYSLFPFLINKERDFAIFNSEEFPNIFETPIYHTIISSDIDVQTSLLITLFHKLILGKVLSKEDWKLIEPISPGDEYVDMEKEICNLENIILAVNLAYYSMLYKDPARVEYSLNDYKKIEDRINLALIIQEHLKNHEWPYNIYGLSYSYLKPNGVEKREGYCLPLDVYSLRYLYGLVKYNSMNKILPNSVFGGGNDVFIINYDEYKYETYLNDFIATQESCAKQYNYLYVFDIRNFYKNVNLSIMKDLYFGNNFSNVKWYDDFYTRILEECSIQGLNPCSEVDSFFANLYLASLDKKMEQFVGIKYFRYGDDIRIYSNDNTLLIKLSETIKTVLSPLSLNMNVDKTKLIDTTNDPMELAKACFIWSSRLCFTRDAETYLLEGKTLAQIIENDLVSTYIFKLLKRINVEADEYNGSLNTHLDNMFYILKHVHKNAALYRCVSELIFDRGFGYTQSMLVFSEILKRVVELLEDDEVEPFVKYWVIRTYYCSKKQYYKQYLKEEKKWIHQYYWPNPCYNDTIEEMLNIKFREKGTDELLFHISDYVISCVEPETLNQHERKPNFKEEISNDDLPF